MDDEISAAFKDDNLLEIILMLKLPKTFINLWLVGEIIHHSLRCVFNNVRTKCTTASLLKFNILEPTTLDLMFSVND